MWMNVGIAELITLRSPAGFHIGSELKTQLSEKRGYEVYIRYRRRGLLAR